MGDKLKRFVLIESEMQAPLELYIAEEANYGNTLAIRTGSAIYSRAFVTPYGVPVKDSNGFVVCGGLKKAVNVRQQKGFLWRTDGAGNPVEMIPCPTEEAFFDALGVPFVAAHERTVETAKRLCPRWRQ